MRSFRMPPENLRILWRDPSRRMGSSSVVGLWDREKGVASGDGNYFHASRV